MPRPLKQFTYLAVAVLLTLGLSISLQSLLAAWVPPTQEPPLQDNIYSPLYTYSSTQPYNQQAYGNLALENTAAGAATSLVLRDWTENPEIQLEYASGSHWGVYANHLNGLGDNSLRFWNGGDRMILSPTGDITANAFIYSSDSSLKKNISPIGDALQKVKELNGVEFEWKDNGEPGIGLIAQDVEKVFPDLVATDPATGLKGVKYGNLVAPLIEAVKEQQKEIEALKGEIELLKANQ